MRQLPPTYPPLEPMPTDREQLTLDLLAHLRDEVGYAVLSALPHQEQLFVAHLLADPLMRQSQAAINAGYSRKRAKAAGSELMAKPGVKAAVEAAIAKRAAKIEVTAERVLREVDTVALSSIDHYEIDWERQRLTLAEGAPPDAMRAVASVKFKAVRRPGSPVEDVSCEIRLWGKPETLRLAMQHRGMLIERHKFVTDVAALSDEDLEAEAKALGLSS